MKKLISLLLVLAMTLCLAACGGSSEETEPATEATEAATEATTEVTTEATTEATEAPTEEQIPVFTEPDREKAGGAAGIAIGVMVVSAAGIGVILFALKSGKKSKGGKFQA